MREWAAELVDRARAEGVDPTGEGRYEFNGSFFGDGPLGAARADVATDPGRGSRTSTAPSGGHACSCDRLTGVAGREKLTALHDGAERTGHARVLTDRDRRLDVGSCTGRVALVREHHRAVEVGARQVCPRTTQADEQHRVAAQRLPDIDAVAARADEMLDDLRRGRL
jgi:hypothetical protein